MEISVYSFIRIARLAEPLMPGGGALRGLAEPIATRGASLFHGFVRLPALRLVGRCSHITARCQRSSYAKERARGLRTPPHLRADGARWPHSQTTLGPALAGASSRARPGTACNDFSLPRSRRGCVDLLAANS